MFATVRTLLRDPQLALRPLVEGPPEALDSPVPWAHSSDLADPTPFLEAGQIVLTTGAQFATASPADFVAYVARLRAAEVTALGFGTAVMAESVPPELITACEAQGLALFEVPYMVPFIALSRTVADRVSETQHERDTWALSAVRAVSFAALRPEGLEASVRELARQLARTVSLHRPGLAPLTLTVETVVPTDLREETAREADRLLARGQRSSSSITRDGWHVSLQTLGRREELRGVLTVTGREPLDTADHTVITSVLALTGLALEQDRQFARARDSLRSAAMQSLLAGEPALVRRVLAPLGGMLPHEPVLVASIATAAEAHDSALSALLSAEESARATLFTAAVGTDIILVGAPRDVRARAEAIAASHGATVGLSREHPYATITTAAKEADRARDSADAVHPVVAFDDIGARGVAWLLEREGARELAQAVLAPLVSAGGDEPGGLIDSLRAWLEANGQWDPAAKSLGIHRHTLRTRISQIETLIARDLSTADARAELWFALKARTG